MQQDTKNKYFDEFQQLGYFEKFDKKYFEEFEKELEEIIIPLKNNWETLSEKELDNLLSKFGKITRNETSQLRKKVLSESDTANTLLNIGLKYHSNNKILIEIISSINNMHSRYNLKITNDIFAFLLEQTKNKKVNFYISIFITELAQFKKYEKRYEYIISIPQIAPKKKSINTFYRVVNDNINDMSQEYKMSAIKTFETFLDNNPEIHETSREKYSVMISKLKE